MAARLYDAAWLDATLDRLAGEIATDPAPGAGRALLGLRTRGAVIAERLRERLRARGVDAPIGYLDATFYRDDLRTGAGLKPVQPTEIPFDLEGRAAVLVDDVLSTGRTVRAAMGAIFDYGRLGSIRLCVMIDRGGRELPIQADFCGAHIEVPRGGFVRVRLAGVDPQGDAVFLVASSFLRPKAYLILLEKSMYIIYPAERLPELHLHRALFICEISLFKKFFHFCRGKFIVVIQ